MLLTAMTTGERGMYAFEKNPVYKSCCAQQKFSSIGSPHFRPPIVLLVPPNKNPKRKKAWKFGLRVLNSGGASEILKEESEFKPAFNEYLKAMEAIRERRQAHKPTRRKPRDGSREEVSSDDEGVRLVKEEEVFKATEIRKGMRAERDVRAKRSRVSEIMEGSEMKAKDKVTIRSQIGINVESATRNVSSKLVQVVGAKEVIRRSSSKVFCDVRDDKAVIRSRNQADMEAGEGTGNFRSNLVQVAGGKKVTRRSSGSQVFPDDGDDKEVSRSEADMDAETGVGLASGNLVQVVEGNGMRRKGKGARKGRSSKVFIGDVDDKVLEVERAAFRNFDESSDVVNKPRVSQAEMEERIQKLAKSLNGADIDKPEWVFSRMMRNAKIKFMDYSMLRLIQTLGKLGNWRRVLQVIEWLQMRDRYKSHKLRHIFTTALIVLGKSRRPVEALNIFQAMQQQNSSYPDLVAYRSIAITLGQAGHLKELFDVIDTMRSPPKNKFKTNPLGKWDRRMEPDLVVYNAVLNACATRKQWEGAFWVLQQLKQKGQLPSPVTYGLVMEVMFSCGKYSLVHEFFRKIQKSSMPNALAYRVLVNTLWKEGKIAEAVSTVQDMEKRGIVGSAALYYDLARCLCSAGRCKEALMLIEKICKVASKPLVVTYTGLVQACLDSGHVQDGTYIFQEMQKVCSPNLVTCNILLKAYLEHGLFDEAKVLFQMMSDDAIHISSKSDYKHRVVPDIHTFNLMLDACVQEKRWDEFVVTYERMLHQGYHFNPKRHLHMVLNAAKAGKGEALEKTWEHLSLDGRVPPSPLIKDRFCMKLETNDLVSALSSLTSHSLSESSAFSKTALMKLLKENAYRFQEETIVRLVDELHIQIAISDSQNLILQNLLVTAEEFLRSRVTHVCTAELIKL